MVDNIQSPEPSIQRIHGVPCSPGTTREMIETFPTLVAREKDIYVVSFPKAGTTWTQEIVWQILHDGRKDYRRIDVRIPWLEGMLYPYKENPYKVSTADMIEKMFESFPSPRVFKSHLRYQMIPKARDKATKPRYIYVMRNPKYTAVSFYHHYHFIPALKDPTSWETFFDQFIKGEVNSGSWFDHVLSWWQHRDDPYILFVKYEDLKEDPRTTIDKIARFIGKELPCEALDLIVQQTTADAMKNEGNANYKWLRDAKGDFIRKAAVGDWQTMFSDEQNKLFENIYTEKLAGTGLEFDFVLKQRE